MIVIKCESKDTLELNQLVEFQGGLKVRGDSDFDKIEKSIKKHGFTFPFFVWKNENKNFVLDGHGRLKTLQRMQQNGEQIPSLPVVFVDCENENEAKEILLKLNSSYGKMTEQSVQDFLGDLKIDFSDLALPDGFLDLTAIVDDIETETQNDDETPEVNEDEPADSQPGEMYDLGGHILMCGDSTLEEDVNRLMGGIKADLVVTDPPYNVNIVGGSHAKPVEERLAQGCKSIQNDKMDTLKFRQFLISAFQNMDKNMKAGAPFYIWYANMESYNFIGACQDVGLDIHQILIWNKNSLVLGRQDYQWRHEPCLYGWKEGAGHYWEGRRDLSTVFDETRSDWKKMSKEQLIAELKRADNEFKTSIIYEDKPAKSDEHPTMKPVRLFERLVLNSSKEEDIVLDPFGGSGTTIITAAKTNRIARVMELDPHYCDVIRKRWTKWAKENGKAIGSGGLE